MDKRQEVYASIDCKIMYLAEGYFKPTNEHSEQEKKFCADFMKYIISNLRDIKSIEDLLKETGYGD